MRVESPLPGRSGGWWHRVDDPARRPHSPVAAPDLRARDLAPPDALNRGLSALFSHPLLLLSERHRGDLRRRGLSDQTVTRNGYATMPRGHRADAARDLVARGCADGVPGFYVNSNRHGDYAALAGPPGLMVPVRDEAGRVRGAQIRRDAPTASARYTWLSSAGRRDGIGSGSPLHWSLEGNRAGDLWVTEGPLKADAAAHLSGWRFLAVAGVHAGQGKRLAEELEPASCPRGRTLVLALDADFASNAAVRTALIAIGHRLLKAGHAVDVATWDPAAGKGIDDALLAGAEIHRTPFARFAGMPEPRVRRRAAPADERHGRDAPSDCSSNLSAAAVAIAELTSALLDAKAGAVHVLEAGLGVGKTRVVAETIARRLRSGLWPMVTRRGAKMPARVAFLVDTTAKAQEVAGLFAAAELDAGEAVLLAGRSEVNCREYTTVRVLGERRHSPELDLCSSCEHASACAYLVQREAARQAQVVIAPKPALLTNGRELASFDLVVSDEDIIQSLYEVLQIDRSSCSAWLEAMGGGGEGMRDQAALVRVVDAALVACARTPQPRERAVPLLRASARSFGVDLAALVGRLSRAKQPHGGRYEFESPWTLDSGGRPRLRAQVPVRALRDLVELLASELGQQDRADTRLWAEPGEGGGRLVAYRPNIDLAEALLSRKVLILDATPDLATLRRVFPDLVHHRIDVNEPLHVTQFSNAIRQSDAIRHAVRRRVLGESTGTVAVLTRKHLAAADGHPEDGRLCIGWWGRHHRAVNDFEGAEAVIIEDRFSPPVHEARAFVEMWRFGCPPAGEPATYASYAGTEFEGRKPGAGEETDADVAAWLAWRWGADVRQAIGRARACRQERAVRVIIESRDPVPGLRVDRLLSAQEYLGWPLSEKRHDALVARNVAQQQEATERVERAIADFMTTYGRLPSQRELCEAARCSTHRAGPALADHRARMLTPHRDNASSEGDADGWYTDSLAPSGGIDAETSGGKACASASPAGEPPNGLHGTHSCRRRCSGRKTGCPGESEQSSDRARGEVHHAGLCAAVGALRTHVLSSCGMAWRPGRLWLGRGKWWPQCTRSVARLHDGCAGSASARASPSVVAATRLGAVGHGRKCSMATRRRRAGC